MARPEVATTNDKRHSEVELKRVWPEKNEAKPDCGQFVYIAKRLTFATINDEGGRKSPPFFLQNMELKEKITAWAEPFLTEQNLFLTDIKILSGGKKIEVFADGDEGITIDQCAKLSRLINAQLEEAGLNPDLDVSSPGMSNPLRVPRQYKRRIGQALEVVKTDGTTIEAVLESADDEKIVLKAMPKKAAKKPKKGEVKAEEEQKIYEVKYSDIKRALLHFNWK